jgi:chromosome segregation ATPase
MAMGAEAMTLTPFQEDQNTIRKLRAEVEQLTTDLQTMTDSYSEISRIVGRQGNEEHSLADDVRALRTEIERLRAEAVLLRREIALMRTLVVQDENARPGAQAMTDEDVMRELIESQRAEVERQWGYIETLKTSQSSAVVNELNAEIERLKLMCADTIKHLEEAEADNERLRADMETIRKRRP